MFIPLSSESIIHYHNINMVVLPEYFIAICLTSLTVKNFFNNINFNIRLDNNRLLEFLVTLRTSRLIRFLVR